MTEKNPDSNSGRLGERYQAPHAADEHDEHEPNAGQNEATFGVGAVLSGTVNAFRGIGDRFRRRHGSDDDPGDTANSDGPDTGAASVTATPDSALASPPAPDTTPPPTAASPPPSPRSMPSRRASAAGSGSATNAPRSGSATGRSVSGAGQGSRAAGSAPRGTAPDRSGGRSGDKPGRAPDAILDADPAVLGIDEDITKQGPVEVIQAVVAAVAGGQPNEAQARLLHDARHRFNRAEIVTRGSNGLPFSHPDIPTQYQYEMPRRNAAKQAQNGPYVMDEPTYAALAPYEDLTAMGYDNIHHVPTETEREAARLALRIREVEYDTEFKQVGRQVQTFDKYGRPGQPETVMEDVRQSPEDAASLIARKAAANRDYYVAVTLYLKSTGDAAKESIIRIALEPPLHIRALPYAIPDPDGERPPASDHKAVQAYERLKNAKAEQREEWLNNFLNGKVAELYKKSGSSDGVPEQWMQDAAERLTGLLASHPDMKDRVNAYINRYAGSRGPDMKDRMLGADSYDIATGNLQSLRQPDATEPLDDQDGRYEVMVKLLNAAGENLKAGDQFDSSKRPNLEARVASAGESVEQAFAAFTENGRLTGDDDYRLFKAAADLSGYVEDLDTAIAAANKKQPGSMMYRDLVDLHSRAFARYLEIRHASDFMKTIAAPTDPDRRAEHFDKRVEPQHRVDHGINLQDGTVIYPGARYGARDRVTGDYTIYGPDGHPWMGDVSPDTDVDRRKSVAESMDYDRSVEVFLQSIQEWIKDGSVPKERAARTMTERVFDLASRRAHDDPDSERAKQAAGLRSMAQYWALRWRADERTATDGHLAVLADGRVRVVGRMYGTNGVWQIGARGESELCVDDKVVERRDRYGDLAAA